VNAPDAASDRDRMVAALRALIEALDQRVPHVERLGEVGIARDAAALRDEAARRIEELSRADRDRRAQETQRSDAVMTDDGGRLPEKK
jgi:ribosomal protein S12 methylthiotransferase accessory factor YcaO